LAVKEFDAEFYFAPDTERAVGVIISDLEVGGYLSRTRVGRRNHYAIDLRRAFDGDAGRLLRLFTTHGSS
jgi:hypothetical protein